MENNCSNNCNNGCNDASLRVPANFSNDPSVCPPNSESCSELFPAECVCWPGPDICELDIKRGDRLDEVIRKLLLTVSQVSCAVGVPGPEGPQGPQGQTGPAGPQGNDGADGADGNDGFTGINFYAEIEEDADIQLSPDPDSYNFPIPSYNILTYTNTTASNMTLKVEASWDFQADKENSGGPENQISNWVDGALIRTVGAVNTVEWESIGDHIVGLGVYSDPFGSGNIITPGTTPEQILTTPGGLETNTLFRVFSFPVNKSIFKKLTLAPNETISLMFKTKGSGTSIVNKAQFFVQQLPS